VCLKSPWGDEIMSGRKRRRDEYGFFPSENQYTKCIQLHRKFNFLKHCNISIE
jgi:hypothetical protein